ncbi:DUF262 domain-containing protein, partial [Clostridium sp.]|uniref:DUF262 domain-containing protein n=1 Tax=Clostridium sp. TaxID=1506 RepID=UPI00262293B7
ILGLLIDIFQQSNEFNINSDNTSLRSKFIGTIVLSPQKAPIVKSSQSVYDIVDGQQRITTLQLILCQLHKLLVESSLKLDDIERSYDRIDNEKSQDMFHWLKQHVKEARRNVLKSLYTESDKNPRSALVNFIPRLIREDKDRWGVEISDTDLRFKYNSGPSLFLFNYLNSNKQEILNLSITGNESDDYGKTSRYIEDNKNGRYTLVEKRSEFIRKTVQDLITSKIQEKDLLSKEVMAELKQCLGHGYENTIEQLSYIFFLISFNFYLLHKVSTVVVIANNESEAFDIFDSLNTTGEPLNAIQVLNALVVSYEISYKGEIDYANTRSKELMDGISRFINTKESLEDRSKLIYEIINSYKISQTGTSLRGKQLSTQIDTIKGFYGGNEIEERVKLNLLKSLYNLVEFYQEVWSNSKYSKYKDNLDIQLLYSTSHSVVVPVLNYFYSNNKSEFEQAVKAVVAFSVLWRVVNSGTAGIDNIYKKLFIENDGLLCQKNISIDAVTAEQLKDVLYSILEASLNRKVKDTLVSTEDKFIKLSAHNDFYKLGKFAKYFLICALENTKPTNDTKQQKLLESTGSRNSTSSLLTVERWNDYEIEHIAPQSKSNGWSDDIYENPNIINYIGNTTIIPKNENIELSNNSLENKVKLYRLYSKYKKEDFDQ